MYIDSSLFPERFHSILQWNGQKHFWLRPATLQHKTNAIAECEISYGLCLATLCFLRNSKWSWRPFQLVLKCCSLFMWNVQFGFERVLGSTHHATVALSRSSDTVIWANLKQPLCLKESVHRTHRTVRHKHPNLPETWTWRQSTKYLSKKPAYFWCQVSTCPLLSSQCSTVWSIRKEACTASKPRTGGGSWSTRILGGAAKWTPLQRFTD